jgi:hypothetical protein
MTRAEQIMIRVAEIDRELAKLRPDPARSDGHKWADPEVQMSHRNTLNDERRALLREYERLPAYAKEE